MLASSEKEDPVSLCGGRLVEPGVSYVLALSICTNWSVLRSVFRDRLPRVNTGSVRFRWHICYCAFTNRKRFSLRVGEVCVKCLPEKNEVFSDESRGVIYSRYGQTQSKNVCRQKSSVDGIKSSRATTKMISNEEGIEVAFLNFCSDPAQDVFIGDA
jgi:hypothetical protein